MLQSARFFSKPNQGGAGRVTAKISDIPFLLIIAAFVVMVVGMKAATAILIPILLAVFISMFFWGWVLGPVGMLLSVPLTMIAKIALASSDDTRWLAVLLE
jgi:predicted PurR-regulated permease PerM